MKFTSSRIEPEVDFDAEEIYQLSKAGGRLRRFFADPTLGASVRLRLVADAGGVDQKRGWAAGAVDVG